MSRPVRAPTGCLPHATAHDKRPPACRPPEFLFPRRFNCGTWRGNNFSAGTFPTGNHAIYPPVHEGIPHRLLPAGNPQHPRFTLKQPLDSPSPVCVGDTRRYPVHPFAGRIKYENKRSYTWHKPKWYREDVMSAKKPYRLTAAFVNSVTRPGRYGDRRGGLGLSLRVKPTEDDKLSKPFRNGSAPMATLPAWPRFVPRRHPSQSSRERPAQRSPRRTGRGHQQTADAHSHPFRGVRHCDREQFAKMVGRQHFRELAPFQTGFRRNRLPPSFQQLSRNRSKTSSLVSCTKTRARL